MLGLLGTAVVCFLIGYFFAPLIALGLIVFLLIMFYIFGGMAISTSLPGFELATAGSPLALLPFALGGLIFYLLARKFRKKTDEEKAKEREKNLADAKAYAANPTGHDFLYVLIFAVLFLPFMYFLAGIHNSYSTVSKTNYMKIVEQYEKDEKKLEEFLRAAPSRTPSERFAR